jgi:IS30 family transposase
MKYHQLTAEERYMLAALLRQGLNYSEIARQLGRHRSTVMREVRRNLCNDGGYRAAKAIRRTQARRHQARRKWHFADHHWQMVISLLRLEWSLRQISGWLAGHGVFSISHETIYRFVWYDRFYGGTLYLHLCQAGKKWRKRYRSVDFRGVMPGKRHISERPRGPGIAHGSATGKSTPSLATATSTASSLWSSGRPPIPSSASSRHAPPPNSTGGSYACYKGSPGQCEPSPPKTAPSSTNSAR